MVLGCYYMGGYIPIPIPDHRSSSYMGIGLQTRQRISIVYTNADTLMATGMESVLHNQIKVTQLSLGSISDKNRVILAII